jgi:hypothetical protein
MVNPFRISIEIPCLYPRCSMVLEYLPTKLGNKNWVNVGVHIPAPWFAYGYCKSHRSLANAIEFAMNRITVHCIRDETAVLHRAIDDLDLKVRTSQGHWDSFHDDPRDRLGNGDKEWGEFTMRNVS